MRQFNELIDWLAANNESARAFALRKKIDKSTFNRLLNGNINQFTLELIAKVSDGTDGKVAHEQFAAFGERLIANPIRKAKRKAA